MDPVHAVLGNTDILPIIFEFMITYDHRNRVQGKHLVAAALVCHLFSDAALDVLWRCIELEKIYRLFPMDITNPWYFGPGLIFAPSTPSHWGRFDAYASRIHELSSSTRHQGSIFLGAVQTRFSPPHYPFPNLTRLSWDSAPSQTTLALGLICPKLTEVDLLIDVPVNDKENAVAEFLRALGDTCPSLRKMNYRNHSLPDQQGSKKLERSLIYLICHSTRLQKACLPVSRNILRALGHLPHLSALQLSDAALEDESPAYPDTPEDPRTEEEEMFVALDYLTVHGSPTVLSLGECFQGSGCFPKEGFIMEMFEGDDWSTPAITRFFRRIFRSDRSARLKTISIDGGDSPSPVEDGPWQLVRCLPSMPHLQSLHLEKLFFGTSDSDLKELSQMCPDLYNLQLDMRLETEEQSQITFEGLVHLSTLQNLESAHLVLNQKSTITESMLSALACPKSPLKSLGFKGGFPNVTIYAAIEFLMLYFPRLERVFGEKGYLGRPWRELETLLHERRKSKAMRSSRGTAAETALDA